MSVRLGIFRVAKAIKVLGHVLGWLAVAAGVAIALSEPRAWLVAIGLGVLVGAVVIGLGHGLAWILEGFAPER